MVTAAPPPAAILATPPPIEAGAPLGAASFADVRRRMVFEHFKWDPQVEDVPVLAPFPLLITAATWEHLAALAEALAAETVAAERELTDRPDLIGQLTLPGPIVRALRGGAGRSVVDSPRVMRFDFHLANDGWKVSEVNSDVPGGFIEASAFTRLIARETSIPCRPAGDPARELGCAVAGIVPAGATVGLIHATAYTDDRQVMMYLARELEAVGLRPCLISPAQLRWDAGRVRIASEFFEGETSALLRFFPAEWLPNLRRACDWRMLLGGGGLPQINPATSLLTQSKRFPLVWDRMTTRLPTWRRLLPETRDPRQADWRRDDDWMLKPALGRVGEAIGLAGVTPAREWDKIRRSARWFPRHWVAQRRFHAVPVPAPGGPVFPCLGVYTVGGRAAGIYGRAAAAPLVNHLSRDVAVLVREQGDEA